MNLTLFVTSNCTSCREVESQLEKLLKNRDDVHLLIEDIREVSSAGMIIVPALFIGEELFSYGDLNEEKLLARIDLLESKS
jgi:hypothetical protein